MGREPLNITALTRRMKENAAVTLPRCFISPVSPLRAAHAVAVLMRKKGRGIFHYSHDGHDSMATVYGLVRKIYGELSGQELDCEIHEVDHLEIPSEGDRPLFNVLDNRAFKEYCGIPDTDWREALREYMTESLMIKT